MLIIDTHLDMAYNAIMFNRNLDLEIAEIRAMEAGLEGRGDNTVSLPELRRANAAVVVGTVFDRTLRPPDIEKGSTCQEISYAKAQGQLAYYRVLAEQGKVRFLGDTPSLRAHIAAWEREPNAQPIGLIPAIEGADSIVWPEQVHAWKQQGLRMASLAHYGVSAYAHGNASEGGLTPAGVTLLREMDAAGIILDLSHLNDQSFFEALDRFAGPVLASHSNCRALAPGERQLSDDQIRTLLAHGGMMGIVTAIWMLKPLSGERDSFRASVTMEAVADHVDHVCQMAGNAEHVGIGSDLDGGFGNRGCPIDLDTFADLHRLADILRRRGYDEEQVKDVMYGNWARFFAQAWSR